MSEAVSVSPTEESDIIQRVVEQVVQIADPEKIILFGSAARGEMGPNSDIDLLVVKSDAHRRKLAQKIYRGLFGIGAPVDIVVATPEDLEEYGNCWALVYYPALREGRVVYESGEKAAQRSERMAESG